MNEWKRAHEKVFGAKAGDLVLYNNYKDKLGILTANFTTPYIITFANLTDGPVLVEQPAGALGGMIMDFWQRPVADLGQAGPDQGKGGRYLVVGPGQKPPEVEGHYIVQSRTNNVFIGIRVLDPGEDKIKTAMDRYKIYPYAQRNNPPQAPLSNTARQTVEPSAATRHAVLGKPRRDDPARAGRGARPHDYGNVAAARA